MRLLILPMVFCFASCNSNEPAIGELTGNWELESGPPNVTSSTRLMLNKDFTYVGTDFPYRLVHYGGDASDLVKETTGTWSVIEEAGKPSVYLAPEHPESAHAAIGYYERDNESIVLNFNTNHVRLLLTKK